MSEGLRSRLKGHTPNDVKSNADMNGVIATGIERSPAIERTDFSLWRLKVKHGQQIWHYITPEEGEKWPQTVVEKYHLGLETVSPRFIFHLICKGSS